MKKNNILMVSANRLKEPYPVYPLGVSYLSTYLSENLIDWNIEILDFNLCSINDFTSHIYDNKYKYICVSLRNVDDANIFAKNSYIDWYNTIISTARKYCNSTLIIGGAGFSVFPKLLFDYLKPDYGIWSEGETSLCELIKGLESKKDIREIEGLVYADELGKITVNQRKDYALSLTMRVDAGLAEYYWKHSGMLNIQTKRGCPYRCIYCSYPLIEGKKVRTLDADLVVENIKQMVTKKMNYLFFTDSVFNICKEYNIELAQKIIDSGVKINWGAYFSPSNLDKEELALYKRSGLTHIEFGSESFSNTQLKNYGKSFTFKDIETTSKMASDLGIFYAHFLILGGYGETNATIEESIENSKKIEHSVFFPYIGMRIYPNTKLSKIAQQEGLITDDKDLINPTYYISKEVNIDMIKKTALASTGKWIFADDQRSDMMDTFRKRGQKGPLWEYLRY
ncbi:MAG: lipid biosynthesis B12-binding/radical SAM protein [Bacteroidales bacterium]